MSQLLVIEIGCEELPPADVRQSLAQLPGLMSSMLETERLPHGPVSVLGTPRRLAIMVSDLASRQEDLEEEFRGPAAGAAYDADGRPTRAAVGFAQSRGVGVDDLLTRETDNGPYVFALIKREGDTAVKVLSRGIPRVLASLDLSRTMFWGPSMRFPRPIRWILALLDEEIVEMEVAGLAADRVTYGHRTLFPGPKKVARACDYLTAVEEAGVILDPAAREEIISRGLYREAEAVGGTPVMAGELLAEVTFLCEHPTVFLGDFDPRFTTLPRSVLETTMRVHQRFFPVAGTGEDLLPHFLAVRDGDEQSLSVVRRGNQRVLLARLADARFFFKEDQKRSLAEMAESLSGVTFLKGMGTMDDKTRRMTRLSRIIGGMLGLEGDLLCDLLRASALCKADLVSQMVGEFPELQGVMGREYAVLSGEKLAVCQAIYEHYLPRHPGDRAPETMAGTVLALVDRLDTLSGSFVAGLRPTGSQDPYGLRRGALGLVEILSAARLHLDLDRLLAHAVGGYEVENSHAIEDELLDFIATRFRGLLLEDGYRYDLVDAVLAADRTEIIGVRERLQAAARFLETEVSADILSLHRRAHNLAQKLPPDAPETVSPELFESDEERHLYRELEAVRERTASLEGTRDYTAMLSAMADLRDPLDRFLDRVLVMAEDRKIRENRLAMLGDVARIASRVADWSLVVR